MGFWGPSARGASGPVPVSAGKKPYWPKAWRDELQSERTRFCEGSRRNGYAQSGNPPAETGSLSLEGSSMRRRNGYGLLFPASQKRVRPHFSQRALPKRWNLYPFLRLRAQKRVRQSLRAPHSIAASQKRVRFAGGVRPFDSAGIRTDRRVHTPRVSGIMRIPRAGQALGGRVFHHSIRMNSISTGGPSGAGNLLRVASPRGGGASGESGFVRGRPAMTLHNKRRQPA